MNTLAPTKDFIKTNAWKSFPEPLKNVVVGILENAKKEYNEEVDDAKESFKGGNGKIPRNRFIEEELETLETKKAAVKLVIQTHFNIESQQGLVWDGLQHVNALPYSFRDLSLGSHNMGKIIDINEAIKKVSRYDELHPKTKYKENNDGLLKILKSASDIFNAAEQTADKNMEKENIKGQRGVS